jgi:hypothetical protein
MGCSGTMVVIRDAGGRGGNMKKGIQWKLCCGEIGTTATNRHKFLSKIQLQEM